MRGKQHRTLGACLAMVLAAAGCGPGVRDVGETDVTDPLRVLFIGNSYTYCHGMPAMIGRLAAAAGDVRPFEHETVVRGGETLEGHFKRGDALTRIREGGWDVVVLQEQSLRPIKDTARFHEYARLFAAQIKEAGARTCFYLTWAREHTPERQADYNQAYLGIARELGAAAAPAGIAWQNARKENPTWPLYAGDRSHPRPLGAYLTACVFYGTLYGRSPVGLPLGVKADPIEGTALGVEEVTHLQTVAWDAVREARRTLGGK